MSPRVLIYSGLLFISYLLGYITFHVSKNANVGGVELNDFDSFRVELMESGSMLEISSLSNGVRKIGVVDRFGQVPVSFDYRDSVENVMWTKVDGSEQKVVFDKNGDGIPERLMNLGEAGEFLYELEIQTKNAITGKRER